MIIGDIIYNFMPKNIKDTIERDSLQWKTIVLGMMAVSMFIFLQIMRVLFSNSLQFMMASIVLTVLVIYLFEKMFG